MSLRPTSDIGMAPRPSPTVRMTAGLFQLATDLEAAPLPADTVVLGARLGPLAAQPARDPAREAVLDRLLASPQRPPVSPEVRARLDAKLAAVPSDVLRTIADHGTHVAVLGKDESLADAGILVDVDLEKRYADPTALGRTAADAFQAATLSFAGRIDALQVRVDLGTASKEEREQLEALQVQRGNEAWRQIWARTGGALDRPFANCGLSDEAYTKAHETPVTVSQIAEMHGAATDEEKRFYVEATIAANGGLIERLAGSDEGPLSQRPFVIGDADLVVPSYHVHRAPDGRTRVFSGHDQGSILNWSGNRTIAQYFFDPRVRTVVFREDRLATNAEGTDTVVHELGHAFQDALRDEDPKWFSDFDARWRDTYHDHAGGRGKFPTEYARYSPEEYFADEFALRFSAKASDAAVADPQGAGLMNEALGHHGPPHLLH